MRRKRKDLRTRVLRCLAKAEGSLWVREISRRTGIAHTTVSNVLDDLYIAGLTIDQNLFHETKGKLRIRLVRLKPGVGIKMA